MVDLSFLYSVAYFIDWSYGIEPELIDQAIQIKRNSTVNSDWYTLVMKLFDNVVPRVPVNIGNSVKAVFHFDLDVNAVALCDYAATFTLGVHIPYAAWTRDGNRPDPDIVAYVQMVTWAGERFMEIWGHTAKMDIRDCLVCMHHTPYQNSIHDTSHEVVSDVARPWVSRVEIVIALTIARMTESLLGMRVAFKFGSTEIEMSHVYTFPATMLPYLFTSFNGYSYSPDKNRFYANIVGGRF